MNRLWSRTLPGLLALSMLAGLAGQARAAAEVHKLSLVLSAIPTQIAGGDFNDQIQFINETQLTPNQLESLKEISFGWLFDAELRYFLRPNFALAAGVGQLRSQSRREYSFTRTDDITITAEVLSVPIHVGGDYYFTPYNQGDFQARAYAGGGFLSLTNTYGSITSVFLTSSISPPGTIKQSWAGDAPGWYAEAGAHMFFAVRYSVMLGVIYRSAVVKPTGVTIEDTINNIHGLVEGVPRSIDMGGAGARMALAIGF